MVVGVKKLVKNLLSAAGRSAKIKFFGVVKSKLCVKNKCDPLFFVTAVFLTFLK